MTAHVPLPLAEKVDERATRLDRSRGWIVKQALADWVEQEEERFRLTKVALSDLDEGGVVSQARMEAWIDSLGTDDPLGVPKP